MVHLQAPPATPHMRRTHHGEGSGVEERRPQEARHSAGRLGRGGRMLGGCRCCRRMGRHPFSLGDRILLLAPSIARAGGRRLTGCPVWLVAWSIEWSTGSMRSAIGRAVFFRGGTKRATSKSSCRQRPLASRPRRFGVHCSRKPSSSKPVAQSSSRAFPPQECIPSIDRSIDHRLRAGGVCCIWSWMVRGLACPAWPLARSSLYSPPARASCCCKSTETKQRCKPHATLACKCLLMHCSQLQLACGGGCGKCDASQPKL